MDYHQKISWKNLVNNNNNNKDNVHQGHLKTTKKINMWTVPPQQQTLKTRT